MQSRQVRLTDISAATDSTLAPLQAIEPHLLLIFGNATHLQHPDIASKLRVMFPTAELVGCSTRQTISADGIDGKSLLLTAVNLARGGLHVISTRPADASDSFEAGQRLGSALRPRRVHTAIVLVPGDKLHGEAFIEGFCKALPTARIAGSHEGSDKQTADVWTLHNMWVSPDQAIAIGFSSPYLKSGLVSSVDPEQMRTTALQTLALMIGSVGGSEAELAQALGSTVEALGEQGICAGYRAGHSVSSGDGLKDAPFCICLLQET